MRVWLAWALAGCIPILGLALPAPGGQWAFRSYGTPSTSPVSSGTSCR